MDTPSSLTDYPPLPCEPTPRECRKWANTPAASCEADRDILSYIAYLQSIDKAQEGGAYLRYEVIAKKIGRTRRTVIRRINRLVELGVILKEPDHGQTQTSLIDRVYSRFIRKALPTTYTKPEQSQ